VTTHGGPDLRPASAGYRRKMRGTLLATAVWFAWTGTGSAYIGDSFVSIPGTAGHYKGKDHKNWIRAEANAWSAMKELAVGMGGFGMSRAGAPNGARPGNAGKLTLMIDRNSPDIAVLMDRCTKNTPIPELIFSESSGREPAAGVPTFWDYKLKEVAIVDCPLAEGAVDQPFVLTFKDAEWLNYDPTRPSPTLLSAPVLPDVKPVEPAGTSKIKSFLITWLGLATDAAEDQCPIMNAKPTEADFFRYMSKEEGAQVRAKNGEKGITYSAESELRGPHRLNVNLLPGIVPDPGLHEPQSRVAFGMDLDGDNGKGVPPKGIRKHQNFTSPDGRPGIDNQLYRVMGCIPGFRGKNGYRNQTDNARRADGNIVTVVEISGIDDEKNDDNVEVALIHAMDKPIRDNLGSKFIPNYTFRPTEDPKFARYNVRVHGRIVNGVVMTDVLPKYTVNSGQGPVYDLFGARMRFEPRPDGSMKGYLAGYLDWRYYATNRASGYSEGLFGYQMPALYYALKHNADGLKDPATGEFNGISTVYELDTVPAFLTERSTRAIEGKSMSEGVRTDEDFRDWNGMLSDRRVGDGYDLARGWDLRRAASAFIRLSLLIAAFITVTTAAVHAGVTHIAVVLLSAASFSGG
jgi:hypothetical protein